MHCVESVLVESEKKKKGGSEKIKKILKTKFELSPRAKLLLHLF